MMILPNAINKVFFQLAFYPCLALCSYAGDLEIGQEFILQGRIEDARKYITRAYKQDSSNIRAALVYASICVNGNSAVKVYQKISENSSSSPEFRFEAYKRIGDAMYCEGKYETARSMYEKACLLKSATECGNLIQLCDRALFSGGKDVTESKAVFTLQVGAFSSQENAFRLRDALGKKFEGVYVVSAPSEKSTLYKVRIGSFPTDGDAREFGEKELKQEDVSFSVVRR